MTPTDRLFRATFLEADEVNEELRRYREDYGIICCGSRVFRFTRRVVYQRIVILRNCVEM